jgi:hypothetical protein
LFQSSPAQRGRGTTRRSRVVEGASASRSPTDLLRRSLRSRHLPRGRGRRSEQHDPGPYHRRTPDPARQRSQRLHRPQRPRVSVPVELGLRLRRARLRHLRPAARLAGSGDAVPRAVAGRLPAPHHILAGRPRLLPRPEVWGTERDPRTSGITQPPVAATIIRRLWDSAQAAGEGDAYRARAERLLRPAPQLASLVRGRARSRPPRGRRGDAPVGDGSRQLARMGRAGRADRCVERRRLCPPRYRPSRREDAPDQARI